jgi:diadenosine tetraphosphatase ApaH/serine/threonine PP2A family protein phosphatase
MGWKGAHRSREREEVKRLRDLERRTKEQAKLSALEQARLEVETHQTRIDLLLSIHKEPIEVWNWLELIAALDPCSPFGASPNELNEKLVACAEARAIEASALEGRRADDRRALEQALAEHAASQEVRKSHRELAARVVRADLDAWTTAIAQLHPFAELEELGVTVKPEFHSRDSVHLQYHRERPGDHSSRSQDAHIDRQAIREATHEGAIPRDLSGLRLWMCAEDGERNIWIPSGRGSSRYRLSRIRRPSDVTLIVPSLVLDEFRASDGSTLRG